MLNRFCSVLTVAALISFSPVGLLQAQPTFKELPGYEKFREISGLRTELGGGGKVEQIRWSDDGSSAQYTVAGKRKSIDLKSFVISDDSTPIAPEATEGRRGQRRNGQPAVGRAQQRTFATSPDGKWKAVYSDFNITLEPTASDTEKIRVTKDGVDRLRFGTGCWVYGEELKQSDAMWWSPDSSKLAYYEVDEREMVDYHLTVDNTANYTKLQSVRYPKAGDPNPRVSIWIYDLASKAAKKVAIDGEPTQYLFSIRFSPEGNELLVNRTNRRQDVLNLLAIDSGTLNVRTVLTERQSTWQHNSPSIQFLEDSKRFVWESEANGWKHFQLRHIDGRLLNPLSQVGDYACNTIQKIDEKSGYVYFTAFSDAIPYNSQLHRVRLDGTHPVRLTSSPLNHTSFEISPDHRFVIATREQLETPPCTVVYDEQGKEVAVLATGDRVDADKAKLPLPELFSFLSDDGKTTIYGTLHKPSNFDASRKYPLLIDVYGGPESVGISTRYSAANPICELGYIIAKIGNRGTVGRGKAFESATYLKLGGPDLDDQAAGVKFLRQRSYIDGERVGI